MKRHSVPLQLATVARLSVFSENPGSHATWEACQECDLSGGQRPGNRKVNFQGESLLSFHSSPLAALAPGLPRARLGREPRQSASSTCRDPELSWHLRSCRLYLLRVAGLRSPNPGLTMLILKMSTPWFSTQSLKLELSSLADSPPTLHSRLSILAKAFAAYAFHCLTT